MGLQLNRSPIVHIRFEGRSLDLPLAELGVTSWPAMTN
jgi:hypothetical protein